MNRITLEHAERLIKSSRGSIFGVQFVKANGQLRDMTARIGVQKYAKGTGLAFDPESYDLLTVFDMKAKGYRMVRLAAIRTLTVDGESFKVV